MSIEALKLRFAVPVDDDASFTEADKTVLARLYKHQLSYRARIEQTAAGSTERANLIGEMYAESWALTAESDFYARYAGNAAELPDRRTDALALVRLSGAKRVLEVGVGQGALADAMAGQGCFVDGIDVAPGLQWDAIQARHSGRVHLWTGKIQDVAESTYDICIADNVLEHVPPGDYETYLDSCHRALKPGGWLVVCIPSPLTGPHDTSRWFTEPGGPATGDHFNERTMSQLKADFQRAGFRNFRTTILNTLSSGRKAMGWSGVWVRRALLFERICARVDPSRRVHPIFRYTIPRTLAGQKRKS
ncbi:MAG TPA: class I SAM-dependent methyltransferase [Bryocella sp.]|nr:class I SAM-dependent methyltransferase [Bryocella sp.]